MREMKDSGIEWIGKIPKHWKTNKMKYLFSNSKGLSITKENLIETGLPVVSYGQIHSKGNSGTDIKDDLLRFVDFHYQTQYPQCEVHQHDFVFADTSEDYEGCGNCVYKRDTSLLFGGYHTIIMHSLEKKDNRYFAYLFTTNAWRKQIREVASGVKVFSITQKVLMNSSVIIPTSTEQQDISNFLDSKCAEIDALTADIQSQIDTLEQYKRSLITETVTKGLNPDVEMKDSGILPIGMIPIHWNRSLLGYCATIVRGGSPRPIEQYMSDDGNGYNWIKIGDTQKGEKYILETKEKITQAGVSKSRIVHRGDLILTNSMSYGEPYILGIDGCIHDGWLAFSDLRNMDKEFLYFSLLSSACRTQFDMLSDGGVVQNLNIDKVKHTVVFVPPIEEQMRIASFLDFKCAEINGAIETKTQQIEALGEYKKSLIFEYVTGKKEVPAV